jgi:hypothetical protein
MVDDQSIYRKHVFDSATYDSEGRRRDAANEAPERPLGGALEVNEDGRLYVVTPGDAGKERRVRLRPGRYRLTDAALRAINDAMAGNDSQQRDDDARDRGEGRERRNMRTRDDGAPELQTRIGAASRGEQASDLASYAERLRKAWGGR